MFIYFRKAVDIRVNTCYNINNDRKEGAKMRYSELIKLLKEAGCEIYGEGKNHQKWYSPKTGKIFPVGRHKTEEVPRGTLRSILKDAGIDL